LQTFMPNSEGDEEPRVPVARHGDGAAAGLLAAGPPGACGVPRGGPPPPPPPDRWSHRSHPLDLRGRRLTPHRIWFHLLYSRSVVDQCSLDTVGSMDFRGQLPMPIRPRVCSCLRPRSLLFVPRSRTVWDWSSVLVVCPRPSVPRGHAPSFGGAGRSREEPSASGRKFCGSRRWGSGRGRADPGGFFFLNIYDPT